MGTSCRIDDMEWNLFLSILLLSISEGGKIYISDVSIPFLGSFLPFN